MHCGPVKQHTLDAGLNSYDLEHLEYYLIHILILQYHHCSQRIRGIVRGLSPWISKDHISTAKGSWTIFFFAVQIKSLAILMKLHLGD
jgi:hypothetical protein